MEDFSQFAHSPAHLAVARHDHASLRRIISKLPPFPAPDEGTTEAESLEAKRRWKEISAVIDRNDVPGRETPLHLAVRLWDSVSAEILVAAGANCALVNQRGLNVLQEALHTKEDSIAVIINKHSTPLAWERWYSRLPRGITMLSRLRDFYMEINFHFESSVIPFISRVCPSDTYRIWKRGSNLRADMTLAGFDGLQIKRSDRSIRLLGGGYVSEKGDVSLPIGSLIMLDHEKKEIKKVMEEAQARAQSTEKQVAREDATSTDSNIGIHVGRCELVPQLNWRRQERTEMVGSWKAKLYDMLHVTVTYLRSGPGGEHQKSSSELGKDNHTECKQGKEKKMGKKKRKTSRKEKSDGNSTTTVTNPESVQKMSLTPVLWLAQDFPMKLEELLPLLDQIKNKSKGARRLRELLTTKFPPGTFPVKVAIPVIPTVRVIVTFTRFEELHLAETFSTPPSSPEHSHNAKSTQSKGSSSWMSWARVSRRVGGRSAENSRHSFKDDEDADPFHIPQDYRWIDAAERRRRKEARKLSSRKHQTSNG